MGLFHDTGLLGPFLCPYLEIAVLGRLRQPSVTPPLSQQRGLHAGTTLLCTLAKAFLLGSETLPGAALQAEGQRSSSASRGLRGVRASLAPPPLQTLGEGPLGQGKRLHSQWVMSGPRGAGTAVSRHPAATPGLGPGAQEEREGDTHSWGTGVTFALPSLPVRFPHGLMCVGFIRSHVPPATATSAPHNLLHHGTPRSLSGCRGAGGTSLGDMQGRNGTSSGVPSMRSKLRPSFLAFTPFPESPRVPTTIHGPAVGAEDWEAPLPLRCLQWGSVISQARSRLNVPIH